jgi:mRNA deadenylase 3'-5' endonuclease subunit Ccr4
MSIKVVTFNILSSFLAEPEYFPNSKIEHLDSDYRFNGLLYILDKYIKEDYIICLQEISNEWQLKLTTFFHNLRWSYFMRCRTEKFGEGIFVNYKYNIGEYNFHKINDTLFDTSEYNVEELEQVEAAKNTIRYLSVLELMKNGIKFFVITLHMPCKYKQPKLMKVYTLFLKNLVNKIAGDTPVILAGDFNILHGGIEYNILTDSFEDSSDEKSYTCIDGKSNKFHIDFIFYRGLNLTKFYINKNDDMIIPSKEHPSDHFPVTAQFI